MEELDEFFQRYAANFIFDVINYYKLLCGYRYESRKGRDSAYATDGAREDSRLPQIAFCYPMAEDCRRLYDPDYSKYEPLFNDWSFIHWLQQKCLSVGVIS